MQATKHPGSCHCGAVRFEVVVDPSLGNRCNCTACTKLPVTSSIVAPAAFTLLAGEAELSAYEWGGRTGKRYFCRTCGTLCFLRGYLEVIGGDYVSVSLNCLDDIDLRDTRLQHFDGRNNNWMAGVRPEPWPIVPAAPPARRSSSSSDLPRDRIP